MKEFKTSQGAYLRRAIEEGYGPPKGYVQLQTRAKAEQTDKQRNMNKRSAISHQKAREGHQKRFYGVYLDYLRFKG